MERDFACRRVIVGCEAILALRERDAFVNPFLQMMLHLLL